LNLATIGSVTNFYLADRIARFAVNTVLLVNEVNSFGGIPNIAQRYRANRVKINAFNVKGKSCICCIHVQKPRLFYFTSSGHSNCETFPLKMR
jgi:hypothetical protein